MASQRNRIAVIFGPDLCIGIAALLLIVPIRWIVAWITATTTHEFFHYLMIRSLKIRVYSIEARLRGFSMETESMPYRAELLCALAGPLGALLLILTGRWFPELAICAYMQSVYNLLPVFPLDGGRALRCIASGVLPARWSRGVCIAIEVFTVSVIVSGGLAATWLLHLGPLPVAGSVLFLFRYLRIKFPCKDRKLRVQ